VSVPKLDSPFVSKETEVNVPTTALPDVAKSKMLKKTMI
jgi:hypothetical protein